MDIGRPLRGDKYVTYGEKNRKRIFDRRDFVCNDNRKKKHLIQILNTENVITADTERF